MSVQPVSGSRRTGGWASTFGGWWRAPAHRSPPPAERAALSALPWYPHPDESIRVLVVDDNPVNLLLMSAMMEPHGFVPLLAADGAEAVALACELPFDLILMDPQMPVLDGFEATSEIRRFEARSAKSAVPVVAFSSSPPKAGFLSARGLNGSLPKPCSDPELQACLAQWCPTFRSATQGRVARGP